VDEYLIDKEYRINGEWIIDEQSHVVSNGTLYYSPKKKLAKLEVWVDGQYKVPYQKIKKIIGYSVKGVKITVFEPIFRNSTMTGLNTTKTLMS